MSGRHPAAWHLAPNKSSTSENNPAARLPVSSAVMNFVQENAAIIPVAYAYTEVRTLATSRAFDPFSRDRTQLQRLVNALRADNNQPGHFPGPKPDLYKYTSTGASETRNADVLSEAYGFTVKGTAPVVPPITLLMDDLLILCARKQGRPFLVNLVLGDDYTPDIPSRLQPFTNLRVHLFMSTADNRPPFRFDVSETRRFTPLDRTFGPAIPINPAQPNAHIRRVKNHVLVALLGRLNTTLPKKAGSHTLLHITDVSTVADWRQDWIVLLEILAHGCKSLHLQNQAVTPGTLRRVLSPACNAVIEPAWLMHCAARESYCRIGFIGTPTDWTSVTDITYYQRLWFHLPAHIRGGDFSDLGC